MTKVYLKERKGCTYGRKDKDKCGRMSLGSKCPREVCVLSCGILAFLRLSRGYSKLFDTREIFHIFPVFCVNQ